MDILLSAGDFAHVELNVVLATPPLASSPHRHQAVGHRPAGLPDHHDENGPHQALAVHRLPPQVLGSPLLHPLSLAANRMTHLPLPLCPPPPSSQTLSNPLQRSLFPVAAGGRPQQAGRRSGGGDVSRRPSLSLASSSPLPPHPSLTSLHLCPTHLSAAAQPREQREAL